MHRTVLHFIFEQRVNSTEVHSVDLKADWRSDIRITSAEKEMKDWFLVTILKMSS